MANNIIKRIWNQNKMVNIEALQGMAFQAEDGGHVFEISGVNDAGEVVPLSGTVAGVFMRPDRADIALTGSASGGVASVTLTDDCYAVPGRFALTVFVTSNNQKVAVYAAIGTVATTSGGAVAGDTPQDVVDLINAINAAVATIPASYTNLMAAVSPNYSPESVYAANSYRWNGGILYKNPEPIVTPESWTAAHWIQSDIGSDLMEALDVSYANYNELDLSSYSQSSFTISEENKIVRSASRYKSIQLQRDAFWKHVALTGKTGQYSGFVTFLTDFLPTTPTSGTDISSYLATGETGRRGFAPGMTVVLDIPSDCKNICISAKTSDTDVTPSSVKILSSVYKDIFKSEQANLKFADISAYGNGGVFTPSGADPLEIYVKLPYSGDDMNQIFTCIAKYEQESGVSSVPTITFFLGGSTGNLKRTTSYCLGGKNNFETKQWRVPRYHGNKKDLIVSISIPVGVTVTVKDLYSEFSDRISRVRNGIRINCHRRFPTTPSDTIPGVEMTVKAGACSMIEIPKRLSDGVWIFYHDDSLTYNDTYIRQADGTELPSTYNGTPWSSIDSDTAFSWDWGVSTGAIFAGLKPMTMEQFFTICGKTGIMPMLSIHPWPSSSELSEIKAIARKCGVLNMLGIKTTTSHIAEAYSVFGNDVESYTVDVPSGTQASSVMNDAIAAMDGLTGCTVRRVVELFASTAYNAYFGTSQYDAFKLILDAGYTCALCQQSGAYHPTLPNTSSVLIKPTDFEYWESKGVTEYTYEYEWSNGLNW